MNPEELKPWEVIGPRKPDPIAALREIAPEWARCLVVTPLGFFWWQQNRGSGLFWNDGAGKATRAHQLRCFDSAESAICLTTGTVHLQQPDGTVIEVTRKEWDV